MTALLNWWPAGAWGLTVLLGALGFSWTQKGRIDIIEQGLRFSDRISKERNDRVEAAILRLDAKVDILLERKRNG